MILWLLGETVPTACLCPCSLLQAAVDFAVKPYGSSGLADSQPSQYTLLLTFQEDSTTLAGANLEPADADLADLRAAVAEVPPLPPRLCPSSVPASPSLRAPLPPAAPPRPLSLRLLPRRCARRGAA